jgi:hypothetical protein
VFAGEVARLFPLSWLLQASAGAAGVNRGVTDGCGRVPTGTMFVPVAARVEVEVEVGGDCLVFADFTAFLLAFVLFAGAAGAGSGRLRPRAPRDSTI